MTNEKGTTPEEERDRWRYIINNDLWDGTMDIDCLMDNCYIEDVEGELHDVEYERERDS